MRTRVIKISSIEEGARAAAEGALAIKAGALVGFATETVYGLAAAADNAQAMDRLRQLKDRPVRPFSVHVGKPEDIYRYVSNVSDEAGRIIRKGIPGPITLLLPVGAKLADPKLQDPQLYERLVYNNAIGIRCPDEAVARAMLSAVESPVVAPSANLTGNRSPRNAADVLDDLDGKIDLLIDSGPTRYGKDSTIIDFADQTWKIVRAGVYDARMIRKLMRRIYLFVCTGNTCRSPIAAGVAKALLAKKAGVSVGDLRKRGIEVISAGLLAYEGAPATPEAILAARHAGADISHHRSQKMTIELIKSADLIFCMTDSHVNQVCRMAPQEASKAQKLDESGDIPDPIGGADEIYKKTAERIESVIKSRIEKGL